MPVRVRVRVLGPVEVRIDDHVVPLGGRKQRAVLALLALRADEVVAVDSLVAAVWGPDATPEAVSASLQVYASTLRKLLGPTPASGEPRIVRTGEGYRLQLDPDELDLFAFRRHLDAARSAAESGDLAVAAEELRSAAGLWREPLLPELADAVDVQPDLLALRERYLSAVEDRVDLDLALGRHGDLTGELTRLTGDHPLRERLHGQLVLTLYRNGRQAEALEAYRHLRETLADELGIDPSPALQRLERSVLAQDPVLDPPEPPPPTPPGPRYRLPAEPNQLIGRDVEVAAVADRLRNRSARVVTLVGVGGVGKTRLAVAAGHAAADAYADGACLVALAPLTDVSLVPGAVAGALGVPLLPGIDPVEQIDEHLADREVLLVLDNAEHLPGLAAFASRLVARAPGVTLVVTSRIALDISAEAVVVVAPLDLPAAEDAPDLAAGNPAVRLFLDRAHAVRSGFSPTDEELGTVAGIVRALDGLPLAIELAASRIRVLPPTAILDRLGRRLALLTSGPKDLPARQRTLRAAIEWSHQLLDQDERRLFERLAVFTGGFTLEDAEAVGDPEGDLPAGVLDTLDALVRSSLVTPGSGDGVDARFTMLETIREFALEQLDSNGHAAARTRGDHAAYFADVAADLTSQLEAGQDQEAVIRRFSVDQANLRAALEWSSERPDRVDLALRLVVGTGRYWELTAAIEEGMSWCGRILPAADGADPSLRAGALNVAGTMAWLHGDHDQARTWHAQALRLQQDLGERAGEVWSRNCLAVQDLNQGHVEHGARQLEEALALARDLGDGRLLAIVLQSLGVCAFMRGDHVQARALTQESLEILQDRNDLFAAATLHNLGEISLHEGNVEEAKSEMQRALSALVELSDTTRIASTLEGLANIALLRGDAPRCLRILAALQRIVQRTGLRTRDLDPDHLEQLRQRATCRLDSAQAAAAWAEGQTLPLERAIHEAVAWR